MNKNQNKIIPLSSPLFHFLAKQIANGRPLWALCYIKRYADLADKYLIQALLVRAKSSIAMDSRYKNITPMVEKLSQLDNSQEVTLSDLNLIRELENSNSERKFIVPQLEGRSYHQQLRRQTKRKVNAQDLPKLRWSSRNLS